MYARRCKVTPARNSDQGSRVPKNMQYKWQSRVTQTLAFPGASVRVLEYSASPLEEPLSGFHQAISRPDPYRQLQLELSGAQAVLAPQKT